MICPYCRQEDQFQTIDVGLIRGPITVCTCRLEKEQYKERAAMLQTHEFGRQLSLGRRLPFLHQFDGVSALVHSQKGLLLADEMGVAKTKQAIDAAQVMFWLDQIDRVVVLVPSTIRSVWSDPLVEYGEIATHRWLGLPTKVMEFHAKVNVWTKFWDGKSRALSWVITNYDYVRDPGHQKLVSGFGGPRSLLILDESSAIVNSQSLQSKSAFKIRKNFSKVLELNGTPISQGPLNLKAQMDLIDRDILSCPSKTEFNARYAAIEVPVMVAGKPLRSASGFPITTVKEWKDLDKLNALVAPYVLRRTKLDCMDLPEKHKPKSFQVPLTPTTWNHYRAMRDDALIWLDTDARAMAPQAAVKALRLAQITSGFIGGVEELIEEQEFKLWEDSHELFDLEGAIATFRKDTSPVREIGREKLDYLIKMCREWLDGDPNFKLVVWCRFRPELARTVDAMRELFKSVESIVGQQKPADRDAAKRLLHPATATAGSACVVGTEAAGGMGITMTAASTAVYTSGDYVLRNRLQSEDRIHRASQTRGVNYFDLEAVGPKGQITVDADIVGVRQRKLSVANRMLSDWRKVFAAERREELDLPF